MGVDSVVLLSESTDKVLPENIRNACRKNHSKEWT